MRKAIYYFDDFKRRADSKIAYLYTSVNSPMHQHFDFYEIAFVTKGTYTNEYDGRKLLLPTDSLAFFYKGTSHAISANEEHSVHFSFLIEANCFEDMFARFFPNITRHDLGQYVVRQLTTAQKTYLNELVKSMSSNANDSFRNITEDLYLYNALSIFLTPAQKETKPKSAPLYAEQLLERLNSFSYLDCSVNDIYHTFPIAKSSLIAQFKELTGYTIVQYLVMKKMEYAEQLLTISCLSVSTVGSMLNYSNLSHFSKQFQKQYGMTPKEYQQVHARFQDPHKDKIDI